MRHDVEEHFRSLTPFEFEVDFGDGFGSDTVPDHTDIDWLSTPSTQRSGPGTTNSTRSSGGRSG